LRAADYNLRGDFDRPNVCVSVRFTLVQFDRMRGQNHYVSKLRFNMASVDIKKLRISMVIPIITNYSSIGEAAW